MKKVSTTGELQQEWQSESVLTPKSKKKKRGNGNENRCYLQSFFLRGLSTHSGTPVQAEKSQKSQKSSGHPVV